MKRTKRVTHWRWAWAYLFIHIMNTIKKSIKSKPEGGGQPAHANEQTASLLTRKQLADRWQVCPHTVARRTDLNPVRLNRRLIRYRLADVLELEK